MATSIDKLINSALYTDEEREISEMLGCSIEIAKNWFDTMKNIWQTAVNTLPHDFLYHEKNIIHYENWEISAYVMNKKNPFIEVRVCKSKEEYLTVRFDNNIKAVLCCVFLIVK